MLLGGEAGYFPSKKQPAAQEESISKAPNRNPDESKKLENEINKTKEVADKNQEENKGDN